MINVGTIVSLTLYTLIIAAIFFVYGASQFSSIVNDVAIAGSIILLLVACLLIMRTIKRLQTPFPNEFLIRIHLANFIIYELLTAPGFPILQVA